MNRWLVISILLLLLSLASGGRRFADKRRGKKQPQQTSTASFVPPESHRFDFHLGEDSGELMLPIATDIKPTGHECEPIRIDVCRGIGYNVTSMPNFVGHELQADAELQLQSFMPLVQYGCSSQLLFFLCSVYTPMCTEKVPVMIGPCRPLCESVKSRCAPVLQELGFLWPSALNCSKFVPENTVDHMCMEGPPPDEPDYGSMAAKHPQQQIPFKEYQPPAMHEIFEMPKVDHFDADQRITNADNPEPNRSKCEEYQFANSYVYLEHPRGRCVPRCQTDVLFTQENKRFIEYWTFVWSILALCSCLFTMISFVATSDRFLYPERAIFYIASCYAIYASAYLYRTLVGRNTIACYQEGPDNLSLLVQEGAHNLHCTVSFLMLYYFGMAGSAWWLILATTWSFNAAFGWSPKRLSQYSQMYHSAAWTLPALQTLAALVTRAVDADELTGTCYVGNQNEDNLLRFVIIPMAFYLGAGILLLLFSLVAVRLGYWRRKQFCFCDADECCCVCSQVPTSGYPESNAACSSSSSTDADSEPMMATGCGDFCRRFRRSYPGGPGLGTSQAGSGHSLLIPPGRTPVNFCSTVSSTSSYLSSSSSASKAASLVRLGNVHYKPQQADQNLLFTTHGPRASVRRHRQRHSASCSCRAPRSFGSKSAALVRSGIFALFYTLPALCVLVANIYEYSLRSSWLRQPNDMPLGNNPSVQVLDKPVPNFEIFNMKIFMSLVIGIKTGIWILTAKFPIHLWRGLFTRCLMKKLPPPSTATAAPSAPTAVPNNNNNMCYAGLTNGQFQRSAPPVQQQKADFFFKPAPIDQFGQFGPGLANAGFVTGCAAATASTIISTGGYHQPLDDSSLQPKSSLFRTGNETAV